MGDISVVVCNYEIIFLAEGENLSKVFNSVHRGTMGQIQLVYGLLKETVTSIMMFYKNMKAMVHSSDGGTVFFDFVVGVL